MNEDDITTLLDRLGRDIEVAHAPVVAVTDAGRQRLRWRHRVQVGAVAAVVLALGGGGLAIQQQLTADTTGPNQPAAAATWTPSLVGAWTPIFLRGSSTPTHPTAEPIVFAREHASGVLMWRGSDECNGYDGVFRVSQGGAIRLGANETATPRCAWLRGAPSLDSSVGVVTSASRVQLTGHRLLFTDASGTLIGIFVRYYPTVLPPVPSPLPGRVPTKSELTVGNWIGPIGEVAPALGSTTQRSTVTFEHHVAIPSIPNATNLTWSGYDGCNWVNGFVLLSSSSGFSTLGNSTTLRGCLTRSGPASPQRVTAADIVEAATQVRLVDGMLAFYDVAGHRLGTLRPYPGVIN